MFTEGNVIFHPNHGAGTLTEIRDYNLESGERSYYVITLIQKESTLLIPVDKAEEIGLRFAEDDPEAVIDEVLSREPDELPQNNRSRESQIAGKFESGELEPIAEALRDLAFYAENGRLIKVDRENRMKAQKLIASEVAARNGVKLETALRNLNESVRQSIVTEEAAEA